MTIISESSGSGMLLSAGVEAVVLAFTPFRDSRYE